MPFGHFISQVHLKNFNSPALDGKLFARPLVQRYHSLAKLGRVMF
jgi:hypothetical protein